MKVQTLDGKAHAAMRKAHRKFIDSIDGKETDFTNGYTWGFVEGYKAAMRRKARTTSTVSASEVKR